MYMFWNPEYTWEEALEAANGNEMAMPFGDGYYTVVDAGNFRREAKETAYSLFDGGWRPGEATVDELIQEWGVDNPVERKFAEAINKALQEVLDNWEPITYESFGSSLPANWEEIAEALNSYIRRTVADPEQAWDAWCSGNLPEVPEAEF